MWLFGMRGEWKSTGWAALARRRGCSVIYLDREIEREAASSVTEIFEREGEALFRERERRAIARVERERAAVALGGGAIAQPGMRERLAQTGTVVYLRATPEQLLDRLGGGQGRPLLAGPAAGQRLERNEALMAASEGD